MLLTKSKYVFQSNKVDLFPDENYWQLTDVKTRQETFMGGEGAGEGLFFFLKPSSLLLTCSI